MYCVYTYYIPYTTQEVEYRRSKCTANKLQFYSVGRLSELQPQTGPEVDAK